jgi:hypothetical protein
MEMLDVTVKTKLDGFFREDEWQARSLQPAHESEVSERPPDHQLDASW